MKKPAPPPDLDQLVVSVRPERLHEVLTFARPVDGKGRYLHWDNLRYRDPPEGFTVEEWWLGTKMARRAVARELPISDTKGVAVWFANIDEVQERVHRIDQAASGHILVDEAVTSPDARNRYLVSSLVEEAIMSSQLEGASTTRQVARQMLRDGRAPRDHDERMIANNYAALLLVERWAQENKALTSDRILDLHRTVTEGTLDNRADEGRLQRPEDDRVGVFWSDQTLLHQPPPAADLPMRLERLCRFANEESSERFLHPVIRAIVLHYAIGYDHPFADGNGRTARALFYWSMMRSGYWLAQYITISSHLRGEQRDYSRSYMEVETDENDLTYFVLHQLDVIERGLKRLEDYLARKMQETRVLERRLQTQGEFNHRQIAILGAALRDPERRFTIKSEQHRHRVSNPTARSDLLALEERGLLAKRRSGKKFVFRPADDLEERLGG